MICKLNKLGFLLIAISWVSWGGNAYADATDPNSPLTTGWRVCSKVQKSVWLAVSIYERKNWTTKGWFRVRPNKCAVVQYRLTNRFAYYYAETARFSFSGPKNLCGIRARNFEISKPVTWCRDGEKIGFNELDFKGQNGRTVTLTN